MVYLTVVRVGAVQTQVSLDVTSPDGLTHEYELVGIVLGQKCVKGWFQIRGGRYKVLGNREERLVESVGLGPKGHNCNYEMHGSYAPQVLNNCRDNDSMKHDD